MESETSRVDVNNELNLKCRQGPLWKVVTTQVKGNVMAVD